MVLLNRLQRQRRIEDFQGDGGAAGKHARHQDFSVATDVRCGQVQQYPLIGAELKRSAQAAVLADDAAVREQGRLGRAGRTGRENHLRAVVLADRDRRQERCRRLEELRGRHCAVEALWRR